MNVTIMRPHSHCSVCAAAIDVHHAVGGGTCGSASCRAAAAVRKLGEQRAIQQAALDAHVTTIRTSIVPTLEIADPQSVGVAVVPASERNVVPLPKKRKSA